MIIDCQQYRTVSILLALQKRLREGIPDPKEREEIKKIVEDMERDLGC